MYLAQSLTKNSSLDNKYLSERSNGWVNHSINGHLGYALILKIQLTVMEDSNGPG